MSKLYECPVCRGKGYLESGVNVIAVMIGTQKCLDTFKDFSHYNKEDACRKYGKDNYRDHLDEAIEYLLKKDPCRRCMGKGKVDWVTNAMG